MPNDMVTSAENPLEPSEDVVQRIRERAYHLWEADGRPEGRDVEYWERARELDAMAASHGAGLLPIESEDGPEEATIQDNLGEFPGRLTDQGDRSATPMPRDAMAKAAPR